MKLREEGFPSRLVRNCTPGIPLGRRGKIVLFVLVVLVVLVAEAFLEFLPGDFLVVSSEFFQFALSLLNFLYSLFQFRTIAIEGDPLKFEMKSTSSCAI